MAHTEPTRAEQEEWLGREVGGKYRVTGLLGRGGMGAVYEAENIGLGKRVALKFIDVESAKNDDGIQRFVREARAASTIESAHIVQVFDVGELDDGRPYIVMELLRGENLGARLQRVGRLDIAEAVHMAVQVLRGLHRAHDNGIVHRDLKPENVFLVETDDAPMFAKIVDFGISKITRQSKALEPSAITQEGVVLGTPFYMAPEQAQALPDLDGRADLWSLGAILYECLAGRRPFVGDTYEQVIIAICTKPAEDLRELAPGVPQPVADVIMQALTRERGARFATAKAFLGALQAATPELVGAVPQSFEPATHRKTIHTPPRATQGPATDVAWSSAGGALVQAPRPATPRTTKKLTRLALIGGATALFAFALILGIASRLRPPDDATQVASSQAPRSTPHAPRTVRIETNPPNARVQVDGKVTPDAILHGHPGQVRLVRVTADGFEPVEQTLTIDNERSVVVFELTATTPAASASSAPPAVAKPAGAYPRPTPSPGATPSPESGSLTGGLELKTDLP